MNGHAQALVELNSGLKKNRDELKPIRERLIQDMVAGGSKVILVGNNSVQLVEKKTKKAVGTKAMYNIIKSKLGEEAEKEVREACEKARGEPVVKHSLKIVEGSEE